MIADKNNEGKGLPIEKYAEACATRAESIEEEIVEDISIEDQIVNEFNEKLAIIHTHTTYVLVEKGDKDFVLDSKASIRTFYENDEIETESGKKPRIDIWFKSSRRRTYQNIIFDPSPGADEELNYNMWRGFAFEPKEGKCDLFWKHVKEVICNGNKAHYVYVRKWCAHLFQKPWVVTTALVLRGLQGTGKGTFVHALGNLLGVHYAHLASLDQILGRFNSHLKNAILIFADEAIWGGNVKQVGALKALITEPKIFIEAKGKDGYWISNYKHLIAASNEDWAVHLDPDDRRFFVLDISAGYKEDITYFNAIQKEMAAGGYEALLHDLLNEDLSGFDPKIMPENYAGFDMKLESASSVDRFIYTSLKEGCWDHAVTVPSMEFLQEVVIDKFYDYYKDWCVWEHQDTQTKEQVGKRLKKIFPSLKSKRTPRESDPKRPSFYCFPPIDVCRSAFEKFYKQNSSIWELS